MNSAAGASRLLVIDDDPGMRAFVAEVGELAGYAVTAIGDATGLERALGEAVDVIILDLQLPGVDGIEVLRELARRGSRAALVLYSGVDARILDSSARLAAAQGLEVVARLQKPVRAAELKNLLVGLRDRQTRLPQAASARFQPAEAELRAALERDDLVVHCQPQVAFQDGRWAGVEALVRWQHPVHGLLYPDAFIGLAERQDLGLLLTYRVLEHAVRQCNELRRQAGFDGALSVNVPAVALHDVRFPEEVGQRIRQAGNWLNVTFELTETSVAREFTTALDVLTRLRMKGYGLSIDDFGAGASGLERLHQLPFTELKIDMQFVRAAETDAAARSIVEGSIGLAHDLRMVTVAEGVETAAAWHWLRDQGCELAQGYFVRKPAPPDALVQWAGDWRAPPGEAPPAR